LSETTVTVIRLATQAIMRAVPEKNTAAHGVLFTS
jgi:hypothetical protein